MLGDMGLESIAVVVVAVVVVVVVMDDVEKRLGLISGK